MLRFASAAGGYRLTIRHGPRVERQVHEDLGGALAAMEQRAQEVLSEGGLDSVTMLREFEAGQRVAARLEISAGGLLRRREAGVDVMGDGELVAYRGAIFKQRLEPRGGQTPFDALREAMQG